MQLIFQFLGHPFQTISSRGRPSGFFYYIGQILAFGALPRSLIHTLLITYFSLYPGQKCHIPSRCKNGNVVILGRLWRKIAYEPWEKNWPAHSSYLHDLHELWTVQVFSLLGALYTIKHGIGPRLTRHGHCVEFLFM